MSALRRQTTEVLATLGQWTAPDDMPGARETADAMADVAATLREIQAKGRGLAAAFGQRDPLTWIPPLDALARFLEETSAAWNRTLRRDDDAWSREATERVETDFAQLETHRAAVLDELAFSARVADQAAEGGPLPAIDPQVRELAPPSAYVPRPAAKHALTYAKTPGYRRRRRLTPILLPAGLAVTALAAILIATHLNTGNHTTTATTLGTMQTTKPAEAKASRPAAKPTTTTTAPKAAAPTNPPASAAPAGRGPLDIGISY